MTLTKQSILQAKDMRIERVHVPEWGGEVCLKSITAAERGQIEAAAARFRESRGKDETFARTFTLKIVSMALCDENGNRLFDDGDFAELAKKNAAVIAKLAETAQRLSGFGKEDLEELEKNSAETPVEGLPLD